MTKKACAVCNGTGLAYDRTECRMVPCGGICCIVKGTDMTIKQVIVMRKDLNMRKGKMCAQAAHASMAFITRRLVDARYDFIDDTTHTLALSAIEERWLDESFIKICVSVNSEIELLLVEEAAIEAKVQCHAVVDNGLTEFGGVPTLTCVALGPDFSDKIDSITGHLSLL